MFFFPWKKNQRSKINYKRIFWEYKSCSGDWGPSFHQCCGAETICFRSGSGSDFQKVSAPASAPEPEPALATALELPVITDFILKSTFFMFFLWKTIDLIYMPDPIQYEWWVFFTTSADPEPGAGAGAETSIFWLGLQPKVPAPCGSGSGSTTLAFMF